MKEQLLVSMYGKKAFDTVAVPDTVKVDQYISSHPTLFADRTRYKLDQIVFDPPKDAKSLQPLTGLHSMTDITSWLNGKGIKFQRGANTLDSAAAARGRGQDQGAAGRRAFIVPNGGKIVVKRDHRRRSRRGAA